MLTQKGKMAQNGRTRQLMAIQGNLGPTLSPCLQVSPSPSLIRRFALFLLPCFLLGIEVPLEFHGRAFLGKYLNSDTTLYNMDASINIYCTMLRQGNFSFFVRYQDDLDMAEQTGGVSLDPRYAHYYIAGGIDYLTINYLFSMYFMHDCIHDIDYEVEGTPVFNRFRLQITDANLHYSKRLLATKRFLWSVELGFYPHWKYNGWDINAGADYKYEVNLISVFNILRKGKFGIDIDPVFHFTKGYSCFYHQHMLQCKTYYRNNGKRIGLELDYNIWNNDPIKNPDKLWLLSIFVEF